MRISVGDVELWFDTIGSSLAIEGGCVVERPTIVAIHGGPGIDHTSLRPTVEPFADIAQVVTLDQRGHGRSDHSTPSKWTTDVWADDIVALCDALSIPAPILFGSSFGGEVALNIAARYPDLPDALIMASSGGGIRNDQAVIDEFRSVGGDEVAEVARRDIEEPSPEAFAEWLEVCLPFYSRRPGAKAYSDEFRARAISTEDVTMHVMEHGSGQPDPIELAGEVLCPTLVVCGAHDVVVPNLVLTQLAAGFAPSILEMNFVPDASHWIFRDNPDHAYAAVRSFISTL